MNHLPRRTAALALGVVVALTATALLTPTAAGAVTPTASARIVGTVTGFDGTHDVPVAGVEVTASAVSTTADQPGVSVLTAADGTYRLPKVLPWTYTVCFSFPTSGPRHVGPTGLLENCHGSDAPVTGSSTPVSAAAHVETVVDEELPRGAALQGTLTYEGRPAVGGRVTAEADASDEAVTDASGHYLLEGLFGSARVCGFPAADPDNPGGTSVCAKPNPTVTAGTVSTLALSLKQGGGVRGRVVDSAGHPVAGATVGANTVTDSDGRFSIGHVAPGSYVLCVQPPAGSALLPTCTDGVGGTPYRVKADTFVTANAGLATAPAGVVVRGTVRDGDGRPLANVQVGSRTTGADGTYSLPASTSPSPVCATPLPTVAGGSPYGYLPTCVSLPAGATGTVRRDLVLAKSGAIAGRYTDAAGHGVAGVRVEADIDRGDDGAIQYSTVTGADGSYLVRNLPTGAGYQVTDYLVDVPRDSRAPAGWISSGPLAAPVGVTTPRLTTVPAVVLTPAAGLAISLVDGDGHPVTRGGVHVQFGPGITTDLTADVQGHAALLNQPAGTLQVCAVAVTAGPLYPHGLEQACATVTTKSGVLKPLTLTQLPAS